MKRFLAALLCLLLLAGCSATPSNETPVIACTTRPVAQFTEALTQNTDLSVTAIVSEPVSCLHDYSLSVEQMKLIGKADAVILSGCGLEASMEDALASAKTVIDSSEGVATLTGDEGIDPHIWLDPARAETMAENIANALCKLYPQYDTVIRSNLDLLHAELDTLQTEGQAALADLSARGLITFHDGFAYFADAYDLTILAAMEEEAGSEPAAADLEAMVKLVTDNGLTCIFAEVNGSDRAAETVARETGATVYKLDTAISGDYFAAMRSNIATIKEAMG